MLVLKDAFPDSEILKDTNLTSKKNPTIITDIIHFQIKLNLYEKMNDSIFTLILDESTDNSNKLQLTIVLKYFDKTTNTPNTTFFDIKELQESSANTIFDTVKFCLEGRGCKMTNIGAYC